MFMRGKGALGGNNELEITFEGRRPLEESREAFSETLKLDGEMAEARPAAVHAASGTVIMAGSVFEGTIKSSGPIRIEGIFCGTISGTSVSVEPGGQISGSVEALSVRIAGDLKGMVDAREIDVVRTAQVNAELTYTEIAIERGARVRGVHKQREEEALPEAAAPDIAAHVTSPISIPDFDTARQKEEAQNVIGLDELKSRISQLVPGHAKAEAAAG
ncbi:MAG TPA: polymer-forming cytoskeletal protein [Acetobacteraceae bacterium]|nr:polymer-forming cytoskeletal protein [Acetobacteraceae bacterium]